MRERNRLFKEFGFNQCANQDTFSEEVLDWYI